MRPYGARSPTELIPVPPDTVNTLLIAGSSGQSMDWPAGAQIVRLTGQSTTGASMNFWVNLFSTAATVPATGSSVSSSGVNHTVMTSHTFQVPGGSTGFSVAALSSGYISVECWRK